MKSTKKMMAEETVSTLPDLDLVFEAGVAIGYDYYAELDKGVGYSIQDDCWAGFSMMIAVLTLRELLSPGDDALPLARVPEVIIRFSDGLNRGADERRRGIKRAAQPLKLSQLLNHVEGVRKVNGSQCGFYDDCFVYFRPIEENPRVPEALQEFGVMDPDDAKCLCCGTLNLKFSVLGPRINDLDGGDVGAGLAVIVGLLEKAFGESIGLELIRWKQTVIANLERAKQARANATLN